jgi:hypothetical protein
VKRAGGAGLFNHYTSLADALTDIYPDYPWIRSKFATSKVAPGFWREGTNLVKALNQAETKLGIKVVSVILFALFLIYFF